MDLTTELVVLTFTLVLGANPGELNKYRIYLRLKEFPEELKDIFGFIASFNDLKFNYKKKKKYYLN